VFGNQVVSRIFACWNQLEGWLRRSSRHRTVTSSPFLKSVGCTIATIASLSEETRRRGARSPWAPGSAGRPQSALGGDARGLL
jgi:hypothetical protein